MNIDMLNSLDAAGFAGAVGWIFEHSPWVAERAFAQRPFTDMDALRRAMVRQVEQASREEQLALLRAHPDLGVRGSLSDASASEQRGAGLDQMSREEFDLFTSLNERYKKKFGFPFLYAVKGSTRHEILNALKTRLDSSPQDEFAEALRQVYRIAGFRLGELSGRIR